jgi:hypothetical protein
MKINQINLFGKETQVGKVEKPFYLIWQVLNLLALGINKAGMKEEDSNQLAGVLFIVFLFVIAGIGEMIK